MRKRKGMEGDGGWESESERDEQTAGVSDGKERKRVGSKQGGRHKERQRQR